MAEAHQAVAFSVRVSDDGIDWNVNFNILKEIAKSGLNSWKKGLYRFRNRFYNGLYPSRPGNWIFIVGGVFGTSIIGVDLSFGLIEKLEKILQKALTIDSPRDHILASFLFSFGLWTAGVVVRKYTLHKLFCYHAWMYEAQRKISLKTKLWMGLVTILSGRNPTLYSYQASLPNLILPKLDDTITGFLRSMEPLLSEEEYSELRASAIEFKRKHGRKFQFYLYLKYLWSTNYVSDWWEELVYLSSRSSLMINSNYYGTDCIMIRHEWQQAARAANIICATVQFMRQLNNEEMEPIIILGKVPLCSRQYERMFCTTRIPRDTSDGSKYRSDTLQHLVDSRHIVVMCRGNFYKVYFMKGENYLDPVDMEKIFQEILDSSEEPTDSSKYLATLTSSERNRWANNRTKYFSSGINKESLDAIERAAFLVILEDEVHDYDPNNDSAFDLMGQSLLHGKGYDRWFDKSLSLIIFKNGRIGVNVEHSWADAPVIAHYWEIILLEDMLNPKYGYSADGHCRGICKTNLPKYQKLNWNIPKDLSIEIESVMKISQEKIDDLDLHLAAFSDFGRGVMKGCRVSPDAFIQMALQLAYYRQSKGNFALTYEASMTRIFREGRTETVRSCSNLSCEFVRGMNNPNLSDSEKIKLFRDACDYHQDLYRDAMTGRGYDRHIFCMYVIGKYLKINSEFLTKAVSYPWKLSTSQTPHSQTNRMDLTRYPNFLSAGGGFGPVANDGYGVSYMMAGDKVVFFHISCLKSCPETNARQFRECLFTALNEIKALFIPIDPKGDK